MIKALFIRTLRRQLLGLFTYALVLFLFQIMMIWLYPSFKDSLSLMMEGLPMIFQGFLGGEHISFATLPGFLTMGITHPLVLLLLNLYPINTAISTTAKEISQKTGDLLFTRPIQRYRIISTTMVNLSIGSLLLSLSILIGIETGFLLVDMTESIARIYLLRTALLIFFFLLAVGGIAFFLSVLARSDTKALAITGGLLLLMYVVDFLAPLWDGLARVSPFMLYHYFRPGDILLGGGWVWDVLVYLGIAILFTTLSMVLIERIDV